MAELGEALKLFLDKIAGFFDIFDLSFFVSGATLAAALAYWAYSIRAHMPHIDGWLSVFAILLACYVGGLISFAGGRWLRIGGAELRRRAALDPQIIRVLHAHGLGNDEIYSAYNQRDPHHGAWHLYVRMWAEIRQAKDASPSLAFCNRIWVMAATFDGLGFALIVWVLVVLDRTIGITGQHTIDVWPGSVAVVLLILFSAACFREARRNVDNQVEELVAAIAELRSRPAA